MRQSAFGVSGLVFVVATAVAMPSWASHSASVSADAFDVESGHGNHDFQLGSTTASASYSNPEGGSASAFATIGSSTSGQLSMKVFATGSGGDVVSNRGSAGLDWEDTLHTTGTLLDLLINLHFTLTGNTSGNGTVSASAVTCIDGVCDTPQEVNGSGTLHIGTNAPVPRTSSLTVFINLSATAGGIAIVGPTSSTADFSHTFILDSITLTDTNGNPVPGAGLASESGFNYNAVIPEPGTLTLCGLLFAMLSTRRIKRLA